MPIIISISYLIAISNAMHHVWVISYSLPTKSFSLLCKIEKGGIKFQHILLPFVTSHAAPKLLCK